MPAKKNPGYQGPPRTTLPPSPTETDDSTTTVIGWTCQKFSSKCKDSLTSCNVLLINDQVNWCRAQVDYNSPMYAETPALIPCPTTVIPDPPTPAPRTYVQPPALDLMKMRDTVDKNLHQMRLRDRHEWDVLKCMIDYYDKMATDVKIKTDVSLRIRYFAILDKYGQVAATEDARGMNFFCHR